MFIGMDLAPESATANAIRDRDRRALLAEVDDLHVRIERLQRALHFWHPGVPADDGEIADRAGDDAMLLVGWDPTEAEPDARTRGWISLRSAPPQSGDAPHNTK